MNDEQQSASEPTQATESTSLAQFLEGVSPGQVRKTTTRIDILNTSQSGYPTRFRFHLPEIQLHCSSDPCNGERFFRTEDDSINIQGSDWKFEYVTYKC